MTIGQRVLYLVNEKGLKQKDLAEFLGTKPSTVNGWSKENRNPSSDLILRICEFLDCSCEFLLSGEEKKEDFQLSFEDMSWLKLIRSLPDDVRLKFRNELEGYLKYSSLEAIKQKQAK